MIYAACIFGGVCVGYLVAALMVMAKEPEPPDSWDEREWYDM